MRFDNLIGSGFQITSDVVANTLLAYKSAQIKGQSLQKINFSLVFPAC